MQTLSSKTQTLISATQTLELKLIRHTPICKCAVNVMVVVPYT